MRSCGATMVQRDSLSSQDEDHIDLCKTFACRESFESQLQFFCLQISRRAI